jgi:hypothetical protein
MISRQHFDVELPMDVPDVTDFDPHFHRGKHYFSQVCLWPVLDLALASSNRGTYAAVLKLDKKIRDWTLPASMRTPIVAVPDDQQTAYIFQRTSVFMVREVALMCLHRYTVTPIRNLESHMSLGRISRAHFSNHHSSLCEDGTRAVFLLRMPVHVPFLAGSGRSTPVNRS